MANKKIIFASNNKGKYDELVKDFKDAGIDLLFYTDFQDQKFNLPEPSEIMAVNAFTKAAAVAAQTNMMALGDDSGIFIDYLDGFPGVHSRRWSFAEDDDTSRNTKILELLEDASDDERWARLISRFSLVSPDGKEIYKTVVKNNFKIAKELDGTKGFGYDPILIPEKESVKIAYYNEKIEYNIANAAMSGLITIGQLTQDEKNAINNRGRIAKEIKVTLARKDNSDSNKGL